MIPRHDVSERQVETACDGLIARLGGTVIRTSPPGRTRQHIGLPDRRYRLKGHAWYFEVKAPTGKLRSAQLEFLVAELDCGALAACGGLAELTALAQQILLGRPAAELRQLCGDTIAQWAQRGLRDRRRGAA